MKITDSIEQFNSYQDFLDSLSEDELREIKALEGTDRCLNLSAAYMKLMELEADVFIPNHQVFVYRLWKDDELYILYYGLALDLDCLLRNSSFHSFLRLVALKDAQEYWKNIANTKSLK